MTNEEAFEIVVVDDDEQTAEMITKSVDFDGYIGVTFFDPIAAATYIAKNKDAILAIVSDFKMAPLNGVDLKKEINNFAKDIPFIILSGMIDTESALTALDLGIEAVLDKPFKPEKLQATLREKFSDRLADMNFAIENKKTFILECQELVEEIEPLILDPMLFSSFQYGRS